MSENYKDGNIKRSEYSHEMRSAYLKYSMSVIVGRALPDVRDGLKAGAPPHTLLYGRTQSVRR